MDQNIAAVQAALKARGYDLGPGDVDGLMGRATLAAIRKFQSAHNLSPDGIVGPLTAAELFAKSPAAATEPVVELGAPWWQIALQKRGLRETDPVLKAFLKSDGHTLGDPARLPWCGDFIETCIALALPNEALPVNPYLARNWLKFGQPCAPTPGAVGVFWRGAPTGTTDGHVAFIAGQDGNYFVVDGGNQSDAVTRTRIDKGRLLGARWPLTVPLVTAALPRLTAGGVSTNEA